MSTNVGSVVSHFPDAENGFTTTLASTIASGATTVPLNSVAGYTNGLPAVFVVDPSDATKKQTFTGIIDTSGVQVTNVVWTAGTNQTHTGGATVVDYATATHIAMVSKGILIHSDQDGTLKAGAVDGAGVLASNVVTTAKILDGNVTFAKLLSTIFSGQLTTYSNPGSAGGTNSFFYGNIGGIKLFFGTTAAVTTSSGSTTWGITYPTSFFTTVQFVTAQTFAMTGVATQYCSINDLTLGTSGITPYVNSTGSGTAKISFLAIGT